MTDKRRFVAVPRTTDGRVLDGRFFLPEVYADRAARDRALGPTGYETIVYASGGEIEATRVHLGEYGCGHRVDEPGFREVIDPMVLEFFVQLGTAAKEVPPNYLKRDGWRLGGDLTIARTAYSLVFEFARRSQSFNPIIGHSSPVDEEDEEDRSIIKRTFDFLEGQIKLFAIPGYRA